MQSTLLLCFCQLHLQLPFTAHCQIYIRIQILLPSILTLKMANDVTETSGNHNLTLLVPEGRNYTMNFSCENLRKRMNLMACNTSRVNDDPSFNSSLSSWGGKFNEIISTGLSTEKESVIKILFFKFQIHLREASTKASRQRTKRVSNFISSNSRSLITFSAKCCNNVG